MPTDFNQKVFFLLIYYGRYGFKCLCVLRGKRTFRLTGRTLTSKFIFGVDNDEKDSGVEYMLILMLTITGVNKDEDR